MLVCAALVAHAETADVKATAYSQAMLEQVSALYGIDEAAAIDRLDAESKAANLFHRIRDSRLEGYAGAWFDGESLRLNVALASAQSIERVSRLGAVPVSVTWSLEELEGLQERITDARQTPQVAGAWRTVFVDYRINKVVVGAIPGRAEEIRSLLLEYADRIEVREDHIDVQPRADVRGGDGTWNYSWYLEYSGGIWKCSVGAAVESGYYTAGHCGGAARSANGADVIKYAVNYTPSDPTLGTVADSAFPYYGWVDNYDTAWVVTDPGWTPREKINGYSDGVFDVPAKWSGIQYPLYGLSVCRYGGTSYRSCGTISDVGKTQMNGTAYIKNLTEVTWACASDGDSGGPLVTVTDQLLIGTLYGAQLGYQCPAISITRYQPFTDHIAAYEWQAGSLLTAHGAAAPTVGGWLCPDTSQSAPGQFVCSFDHYYSQGITSHTWYLNNVALSEPAPYLYEYCTPGHLVRVKLKLTNPYGSDTTQALFTCPE